MNIFLRFFEIIPRLGWLVMTPVFLALTGRGMGIGTVAAFLVLIGFLYLLFRPYKESTSLHVNIPGAAPRSFAAK